LSDTEHSLHFDQQKAMEMLRDTEPSIDRRARRTRQALHRALIGLILERGYDGLTVADIADRANVGRSTFYAHFTDKDDLMRGAAGNLKSIVMREHAALVTDSEPPEARILGFSRFMTPHLYEQRRLFHAMMKGAAGQIVLEVMGQVLRDIVSAELAAMADRPLAKAARETAVQFIVGGYIAVLTRWLERGAKEKPEVIEAQFRALALGSIRGLMSLE
jgi:AcrR family transcriptional regulator